MLLGEVVNNIWGSCILELGKLYLKAGEVVTDFLLPSFLLYLILHHCIFLVTSYFIIAVMHNINK